MCMQTTPSSKKAGWTEGGQQKNKLQILEYQLFTKYFGKSQVSTGCAIGKYYSKKIGIISSVASHFPMKKGTTFGIYDMYR